MNKVSIILTTIFFVAMIVIIVPNIFAFNRGRVLRNIAIWLAIFVGLGLIYQTFGPQSAHPLFGLPPVMARGHLTPVTTSPDAPSAWDRQDKDKPGDGDGAQGFTPPHE